MDCYLLTLYVSLEQELAIRELFVYNGWNFSKYEDSTFENYDSKEGIAKKQALDSPNASPTTGDSATKNLDTSEHSEIFSDLQHFVEATLIAVSKTECGQSENESSSSTNEIYCIKQSSTISDVKGIGSDVTGTSESIDGPKAGIDVTIDDTTGTNSTVNKMLVTSATDGDNSVDVNKAFFEEISDSEMVDESSIEVKQSFSLTESEIIYPKSVKIGSENIVLPNSADNQSRPSVSKGLCRATEDWKADKNKKDSREKGKFKNNLDKNRNTTKGRKNLNEETVENTENNNTVKKNTANRKKRKTGVFHCKECDNTFRLLGAYKNHKRDGKCLFECEYCGKAYTARYYSNYKSHLKYHLKERPHKCDVCGKAYIEAHTLKIHMRKHSGDRPYICQDCGLQFYSSSHLISHRNSTHIGTRQTHICDICDAPLSTLGNLRVHKKVVHAVERPFTCEICGKSFKTQKSLEQVHAKVHSEDFPYKCDFRDCGKVFKRSEGLMDHMRRHNNERNHFCEKCGKGFYTKKDLMLHIRTHTGEKPHQCHLCDYKCALGGNLRKHLKTHQLPLLPSNLLH